MPRSRKNLSGFSTSRTIEWSISGVMCQPMPATSIWPRFTAARKRSRSAFDGVDPPVHGSAGDLAGPAEPGVIGVVGSALGDIERLVDEAAVQLHHHRLRVGVADVGVAVMDEEDFVDHGEVCWTLGEKGRPPSEGGELDRERGADRRNAGAARRGCPWRDSTRNTVSRSASWLATTRCRPEGEKAQVARGGLPPLGPACCLGQLAGRRADAERRGCRPADAEADEQVAAVRR
jgi:hypothetical protein